MLMTEVNHWASPEPDLHLCRSISSVTILYCHAKDQSITLIVYSHLFRIFEINDSLV